MMCTSRPFPVVGNNVLVVLGRDALAQCVRSRDEQARIRGL